MDVSNAVLRLQRGDLSALDEIFDAYASSAIRTAYLITRSQDFAEDAVQEAFIQVIRKVSTLRDPSCFRAWFFQIVVNSARRVRRQGSRFRLFDREPDDCPDLTAPVPEDLALNAEEVNQIRVAIGSLREAHREPLILRYFTGLSEAEVAQILGVPQGTVKSRLHAARRLLHEQLTGNRQPRPVLPGRSTDCCPESKG